MRSISAGLLLFGAFATTLAVPSTKKPPCCPRHEVFTECGSACPATCDSILERNAHRVCPDICVRGCVCREGYVRNRDGKCIPPERCDYRPPVDTSEEESGITCHRPNEVFSECGSACPETCDTIADDGSKPPRACTKNCVIGCTCREGYVRNPDGECVLPEECPRDESLEETTEHKCGCNEEFNRCGTACPDTCEIFLGIVPRPPCIKLCVSGCFCKKGFVRNHDGKCVPTSECSALVCPPNEVFKTCGTACPETCDTIREPDELRPCTLNCVVGCACQDGFVRNPEGRCVLPSECPALPIESSFAALRINPNISIPKECAKNEVFTECGTTCPDTCDNLGDLKPRLCTTDCFVGCICQEGFVRNNANQCVLPSECPNPKCGPNEFYTDCGGCQETCDTINGFEDARACLAVCVRGCFCKEGFVRNKDGQCVPPSECPNITPVCPKNEIFSKCGTICPNTCDTILGLTDNRFCPEICRIGCVCQDGFVRNQNGNCVPPSECPGVSPPPPPPPPKCGTNEVFSQCGSACPDTCDTLSGLLPPRLCPAVCIAGCICRTGYVRNSDGKCVPPSQCPRPRCGIHEVYLECGSACPKTCRNVLNPNIEIACIDKCVAGCFCRDGFVRHEGRCVRPEFCRRPVDILTVDSIAGV